MSYPSGSNVPQPINTATETLAQYEKEGEREITKLAEEDADTTDSNLRYMAYARRLGTALRSASRYTAYTSDIGEAFRPVVAPWIVRGAYGISWAYLVGDVSYETYKAKVQGPSTMDLSTGLSENGRLGMVAVKRSIFQAVASMALPAFTIHSAVRYSTRAFARSTFTPKVKAWGPTMVGLGLVPALPYMFDEPVEYVVDNLFEALEHQLVTRHAGKSAVDGVNKVVGAVEKGFEEVKREL